MQPLLPPHLLLRRRDPHKPVPRVAAPAVQAREVKHAAAEGEELIFGDGAGVGCVVRGGAGVPVGGREDAGRAELEEVGMDAGVDGGVGRGEEGRLVVAFEGESDEDKSGGGEGFVCGGVGGIGVEDEFDGGIPAGCAVAA